MLRQSRSTLLTWLSFVGNTLSKYHFDFLLEVERGDMSAVVCSCPLASFPAVSHRWETSHTARTT
jgi:hypothetical protein